MGQRRRVWLEIWEWDCCGDPIAVGARVTLQVFPFNSGERFAQLVGPELASTIDGVESHHDESGSRIVTGVVTALAGVSLQYSERQVKQKRPPDRPAVFTLNGPGWTAVSASAPVPPDSVTVREPIPGTATLVDLACVPWSPAPDDSETERLTPTSGLSGYLVDMDVDSESLET